ncbi:MAG: hypoxanthine phosphoribosyltransferase [Salibacteraceae bacterium]
MAEVKLHDRVFEPFISSETISNGIKDVAHKLNEDFKGEPVLFVGVLNGAFRFISDLMKDIELECEVSFVKLASYSGTESQEIVSKLIGLNESLDGKNVIIVEDIVDTGNTLVKIMAELESHKPKSVKIATLLYKPDAYKKEIPIDYVGVKIPNDFIVGFGLDYDGLGRNLNEIYKIVD